MLWVLAFWVMALGYSRNKSGIRCLKTLRALLVRVGNKWSWFWPRVSIWYNSLLNVNIVPKYSGSDLFTNLYQNFIHWTSNISLTFSISSSLNNGSVWALYLLFVIMRRARFCSLNILFHSRFAPSQWETSLQSNGVSHWLGANLEPALLYHSQLEPHILYSRPNTML